MQASASASCSAQNRTNARSRSWEQDERLQRADEEARQHPGSCSRSAGSRRGLRTLLLPPLLIAALCSSIKLCDAVTPLSGWIDAIATNYGGPFDGKNPSDPSWGTSEGSCGYGMLDKSKWPYWSVAALSTSNSFALADPIKGCGQCFEIKCNDNGAHPEWKGRCITGGNQVSVVVQITDSCPECPPDHIDIQAMTFDKLSPMALGRIDIQYRRVECVPPTNLAVYVDQNFGQDKWLRLFVEQAGGKASVKQVKIKSSSSSDWLSMENKWGGAFEYAHAPSFPIDVMIYGDDGPVTANGALVSGGLGKTTTGVQFYITNPTDSALVNKIGGGGGWTQAAQSVSVSDGACNDVASTSDWSCADQKGWGHCNEPWMVAGNSQTGSFGFCAKTCGRCPGGDSATGGRKLLREA